MKQRHVVAKCTSRILGHAKKQRRVLAMHTSEMIPSRFEMIQHVPLTQVMHRNRVHF